MGKGRTESYCLMVSEFLFGVIKKFWKQWRRLQNIVNVINYTEFCTLRNENVKFYVKYIFTTV